MENIYDIKNNKTYLDLDSAEKSLEILLYCEKKDRNVLRHSGILGLHEFFSDKKAFINNAYLKVIRMLFTNLCPDENFSAYVDKHCYSSKGFSFNVEGIEFYTSFQDYYDSLSDAKHPEEHYTTLKDYKRVVISYNKNEKHPKSMIIEIDEKEGDNIFNLYYKKINNNYDEKYLDLLGENDYNSCSPRDNIYMEGLKGLKHNVKIEILDKIANEHKYCLGKITKKHKNITMLELEKEILNELKNNVIV